MLRTVLTMAALGTLLHATPTPAETVAPVADQSPANPDPWEPTNRGLFELNKGLDRAVVRPTATFYQHAVVRPVREGVHNVITNLGEPVTFINDVLQVRPSKAGATVLRFGINSTVGVLGVFDMATGAGLPPESSGFAQTLGRYGAPEGPYVFIPVLGPSSVRDITGRIVDFAIDPINFVSYRGRAVVEPTAAVAGGLDTRVELDATLKDVNRTATDPYATLRSGFLQISRVQANGGTEDVKSLPDFGPEPGPPAPTKPHP